MTKQNLKFTDSAPQPGQSENFGQTPPSVHHGQNYLNGGINNIPTVALSSTDGQDDEIMPQAPQPRFSYLDIDIKNMNLISQHLSLPDNEFSRSFPFFELTALNAIQRTINEWIEPIMVRSIYLAVTATIPIVRNNFALDPDENRMRTAAHQMVRNLAAGVALAILHDKLVEVLIHNLRSAFIHGMNFGLSPETIEAAVQQLSKHNLELACCFIQKVAAEKATHVLDVKMIADFVQRKSARESGRSYCPNQEQAQGVPGHIPSKIDSIPSTQITVYEEFARNIPGFKQMSEENITEFMNAKQELPGTSVDLGELNFMYDILINKMQSFLKATLNVTALQLQASKMHALMLALNVTKVIKDKESALNLLSRMVESLLEGLANIPEHMVQMTAYRDILLTMLPFLNKIFGEAVVKGAVKEAMVGTTGEEHWNKEALKLLIPAYFKKRLGIE